MAHQPTQGHKHKHKDKATTAHAQGKSSKASKALKPHKYHSKSATQHPVKQSGAIQKPPKTNKTVSAAGLFKKAKHDDKKHRKRKQPTPEPSLKQDLRGTISILPTYNIAN